MSNKLKETPKVNKRNIPVHVIFWLFVILLLYLFYIAVSGHSSM